MVEILKEKLEKKQARLKELSVSDSLHEEHIKRLSTLNLVQQRHRIKTHSREISLEDSAETHMDKSLRLDADETTSCPFKRYEGSSVRRHSAETLNIIDIMNQDKEIKEVSEDTIDSWKFLNKSDDDLFYHD